MNKTATTGNEKTLRDFLDYREADEKLTGLKIELGNVETKYQTVNDQLLEILAHDSTGSASGKQANMAAVARQVGGGFNYFDPSSDVPTTPAERAARDKYIEEQAAKLERPTDPRLDAAVERVLAGDEIGTPPSTEPLRRELGTLEYQRKVLRAAITKQTALVEQLMRKYSRIICERQRSKYSALVRQTAAALHKLVDAEQEMRDFWSELDGRVGYASVVLPPLQKIGIGTYDDPQSRVSAILKDAESIVHTLEHAA